MLRPGALHLKETPGIESADHCRRVSHQCYLPEPDRRHSPSIAKIVPFAKILIVRAVQYSVVAFPRLDNEAELRRLRDRFRSWVAPAEPHIPVVLPFTPLDLAEIQHVADHVSSARRRLQPQAVTFRRCYTAGDRLFYKAESGWDELVNIHAQIIGSEPIPLLQSGNYEPRLVLGRVLDPAELDAAAAAVTALIRTLGLVDSLTIVEVGPDEALERVASYPFGIGRVDYYRPFPA